ncbi:MAG: hypothetical protein ABIP55_02875, partial [Tepidisphaeraceae bacterium]
MGTADSSGNTLYYGDNLDILRRYVDDESVDLIYLDPPFNSNADCNVRRGTGSLPVASVLRRSRHRGEKQSRQRDSRLAT